MKYLMIIMVLCISAVLFLLGTCNGLNTIVHTHVAESESPGWSSVTSGIITGTGQFQSSFTDIQGDNNFVEQGNIARSYLSDSSQIQANNAYIFGSENVVSHSNNALFTVDEDNDKKKQQIQSNLLLIIGSNNIGVQSNAVGAANAEFDLNTAGTTTTAETNIAVLSNTATSGSEAVGTPQIQYVQSNIGLIIGSGNWLYQSNKATAPLRIPYYNHFVMLPQRNIAFAINNCYDCEFGMLKDESLAGYNVGITFEEPEEMNG